MQEIEQEILEVGTRAMDYALVALRMLNNKYDEKMEEEYSSMLDLAIGFIPPEEINAVHISGEVPNIEDYMDAE